MSILRILDRLSLKPHSRLATLALMLVVVGLAAGVGKTPAAQGAAFNIPDGDVAGLIAAINTSNGNAGTDTINLAAGGTYILTTVDNSTDGENGLPSIVSDITINGNGATIARSGAGITPEFRVFHVGLSGTLMLDDLTVTGGIVDGFGGCCGGGGIFNRSGTVDINNSTVSDNIGRNGGGIKNGGILTITDSIIDGNHGSGGSGGGIFNELGGLVSLSGSTVSGNTTIDFGGGIRNGGTLTITDSTIDKNAALTNSGGGIFNVRAEPNSGTLTLINSTVSNNTTLFRGGGIWNNGTTTLTNSTISGNENDDNSGGGIANSGQGEVVLTNSTVSGNTAIFGGGIFAVVGGGGFILNNTIIANNVPSDCFVDPVDFLGHNLDSDGTCGLTDPTDLPNTDPLLGPLVDNGGPTLTHALLPDSPAIDAVPIADCTDADGNPLVTDQRYVARPQGADCDIGAFEVVYFTVDSTIDSVDANPGDGVCDDGAGNCTLRAAIMEANDLPGTDIIILPAVFATTTVYTLTIPGAGEDASATGDLDITDDLAITGAGAIDTIIDGGGLDRVFHIEDKIVEISGVTIQYGDGGNDPGGGGILNNGTLKLTDVNVSGNSVDACQLR